MCQELLRIVLDKPPTMSSPLIQHLRGQSCTRYEDGRNRPGKPSRPGERVHAGTAVGVTCPGRARCAIHFSAAVLAATVRRFLPEVRRQRCTVHLQRNVLAKVPHRLRKRVAREVAAVFRDPGLAKAKKRLAEITARWHNELPEAMRVLERGFTAATQFYAFPEPHWARLRTTNSLEERSGAEDGGAVDAPGVLQLSGVFQVVMGDHLSHDLA